MIFVLACGLRIVVRLGLVQAISKFRIGVDKDGQGVDRPERGASASFQVAKFEVLPALLAHV